jgi:hypothetical protein
MDRLGCGSEDCEREWWSAQRKGVREFVKIVSEMRAAAEDVSSFLSREHDLD